MAVNPPRQTMAHPTSTDALLLPGLQLRQRDPRALLPFADELRGCAGSDARLQAYADLFEAWGQLARGERAAAERVLAGARNHFELADDLNGQVMCRGIETALWLRDGRLDDVLSATRASLAIAEADLSPWVRFMEIQRLCSALEQLGRYDEALRAHYEGIALARRIGDAGLLANALGSVGGLQYSLMNLADALVLCEEAWSLCAQTDWPGVIHLVGVNLMSVLSGLGRHAEALPMADRMIACDDRFPTHHRGTRRCLYAMTLARAQHFERAQTFLNLAQAERADIADERAEWVWGQAFIHNRSGRAAEALALIECYLARHLDALVASDFPVDRAYLYAEAASASEALGEPAKALVYERQAAAAREQAGVKAAHAGRLTLQINHELAAAHRARDEAVRERERALVEQSRLAEVNSELEYANAAKTRFLAAASHDLRQPVQALAMYMAALQREPSATRRAELMLRMDQSLQALGSMFDVLLDVSRLDAGLVPVQPAALRLDELLGRLVDEYTLPARERGLALRLRLPRDVVSPITLSDAVLLESCLRNLLSNAIKYTERGGVVLRLRAVPALRRWRIELRDTGIGIEPALQALVFQEFFQVDNDERDRSKGLGLGLAIVKRTAALLQHPVGLRSRPGRGSCFCIDLPRIEATREADMPDASSFPAVRCSLIVIDDDAAVRDSLAALLQRWGHQVVEGADAAEVLLVWHRLGCPPVGAAIVDLRLRAGRTGLDAIADLRTRLGADLPALVITGDMAAGRLRLLADAGQAWLPKPLMPLRLRSWLQALPPP